MTNISASRLDTPADFSTYHSRLKWARARSRMTQNKVCAMVGMTQGAYSQLEAAGTGSEKTASIARALGVDPVWLESGEGAPGMRSDGGSYVSVRRVGVRANASITGEPVVFIDEDGEPIYFQRSWLESQGLKAEMLRASQVSGSSMETTVYDGDMVVFNLASKDPRDGRVYVVNADGEVAIKRLTRESGQWWMDSDNPDKTRYPRKLCGPEVRLIGEVIHRQSTRI